MLYLGEAKTKSEGERRKAFVDEVSQIIPEHLFLSHLAGTSSTALAKEGVLARFLVRKLSKSCLPCLESNCNVKECYFSKVL